MRWSYRKSIRIPGGGRINVSSRGVSTSWGVGGLRVRFGPGSGRSASRDSRTRNAGNTETNGGTGCLAVLGVIVALVALSLVIKVLMTPWPWIAIGLYAVYSLGTTILSAHRRQRARQAVLAVCSAQLDLDESRLERNLARLQEYARSNLEAATLLSAHQAMRGKYDVAIDTLQRLRLCADDSVAASPLEIQFPGIPVPIRLMELTDLEAARRVLREHLLAVSGRASEVVRTMKTPDSPELIPISTWVLAEAHVALQDHQLATATLKQAVDALHAAHPAWTRAYRRMLASEYELLGFLENAIQVWRVLAGEGDGEAKSRMQVAQQKLEVRQRDERQRAIDAAEQRRAAEEAHAQAEADRRELAAAARTSAKVKGAKTPAGRRSALQSGLLEISSPELRQQLTLEAARAEVEAVLVKATTLKTTKTKRRHLEDALTALRADEIPDELQEQEIALLEKALADLTSFGTLDAL